MSVKQGDTVVVDGVEATVQSIWGQGRHTAYHLSDGRVALDLQASEPEMVQTKPLTFDLNKVIRDSKLVGE
jgi:hypothetical protein